MKFRGKYWFLSNFYPVLLRYSGIVYPTAEHAYVASKTLGSVTRRQISNLSTPGKAKRFGKAITPRPSWHDDKLRIMKSILRKKFPNGSPLRFTLNEVKGEIIEHNYWHDNYWGACLCTGCEDKEKHNHLGKLLMEVRDG